MSDTPRDKIVVIERAVMGTIEGRKRLCTAIER